jgi:lipopolysaccharide/colanic/teichoic acid biosynthesis glycosyltransferase
MKRVIDIVVSLSALVLASPLLFLICLLIFLYDFQTPFYIAPRVGKDGKLFPMVKFRSMVVNADKTGVTSTSATDRRITPIGRFVRKYKLDELLQLWNVLVGHMSLVGPRPNVKAGGTDLYTSAERRLLTVRPGITDFASIVFTDEGDILRHHADPDAAYDVLIRPWKSRLGLFYIDNQDVRLDAKLIFLTLVQLFSRRKALSTVSAELRRLNAPMELARVALRQDELRPSAPP